MPPGMFGKQLTLRDFVTRRADSVVAQLAGTRKGFVPVMSFGPPGGRGKGPGGQGKFGPGLFVARPLRRPGRRQGRQALAGGADRRHQDVLRRR